MKSNYIADIFYRHTKHPTDIVMPTCNCKKDPKSCSHYTKSDHHASRCMYSKVDGYICDWEIFAPENKPKWMPKFDKDDRDDNIDKK